MAGNENPRAAEKEPVQKFLNFALPKKNSPGRIL
jgi:hypothetical protein